MTTTTKTNTNGTTTMTTLAPATHELERQLRTLSLSGMAQTLMARNQEAISHHLAYTEFLELLVSDELARRRDRLFARRLKMARVPQIKTLENFDWSFNPQIPKALILDLGTVRFIPEHGGLLLLGPPGTGKSHIALSLTVAAIQAGYTALYRSAFDLAQDLAEAEATGTRPDLVRKLTRVDLLVIEDLGMRRRLPAGAGLWQSALPNDQDHPGEGPGAARVGIIFASHREGRRLPARARSAAGHARVRAAGGSGVTAARASTTLLTPTPPPLVPMLKTLRLGGMQDTLPLRLDQAQQQRLGYLEFLELLLGDEIERRANRALATRLSKAHFEDSEKTFENLDWTFNPKLPQEQLRDLATGGYLAPKEHILLCGPAGGGKTHLAEGLGHQAARQGYRVEFIKTSRLLSDLGGGHADGTGTVGCATTCLRRS